MATVVIHDPAEDVRTLLEDRALAAMRGERKCIDCRHEQRMVCLNSKARDYIDSGNIIVVRSVGCMWWGDWWEAR